MKSRDWADDNTTEDLTCTFVGGRQDVAKIDYSSSLVSRVKEVY